MLSSRGRVRQHCGCVGKAVKEFILLLLRSTIEKCLLAPAERGRVRVCISNAREYESACPTVFK
jgi:hypothetical protein